MLRQVELADRVIKRPVSLTSLIQSTNPFADGAGHTTNKPYIKGKIDTHIDQFPNSDHVVMVNFLKRTFSVCHNWYCWFHAGCKQVSGKRSGCWNAIRNGQIWQKCDHYQPLGRQTLQCNVHHTKDQQCKKSVKLWVWRDTVFPHSLSKQKGLLSDDIQFYMEERARPVSHAQRWLTACFLKACHSK